MVISYGVMQSRDTFVPTPSRFLVGLFLNKRGGHMPSIVSNSSKFNFVIIQRNFG